MTSVDLRPRLVEIVDRKPQTLSIKLDLNILVEFAVAARIFRARSVSSFLHHYVVGQIAEAKKLVTPEEFQKMFDEQMKETLERSKMRSNIAKKSKRVPAGTVKLEPPGKLQRKTG